MALASPSISPSLDTTKLSRNDNWLLIPSERRRDPRSGSRYHILDPSTELDTFTHTHTLSLTLTHTHTHTLSLTHSQCHRVGQACRTPLLAFWWSFIMKMVIFFLYKLWEINSFTVLHFAYEEKSLLIKLKYLLLLVLTYLSTFTIHKYMHYYA